MKLISIAITILLLFAADVHAADNLNETRRIAQQVNDNARMTAEARLCPAELMRTAETAVAPAFIHCSPGKMQACLTKCIDGHANSCNGLAIAVQRSEVDNAAAQSLLQRACKLGLTASCVDRARGMWDESSAEPVLQCVAQTSAKACDYADPGACYIYAVMLSSGKGVARNEDMALHTLEKSCKYGPKHVTCKLSAKVRQAILDRQRKRK